ncbi:uncharacterized protein [Diabrotica undecimpunctata]|uniref:uncharacterized protein n=1 Tax=Diabrotica undecimpunctata TaxID=50387 RepID=UPI003B63B228
MVHELTEDDPDRRLQYCETIDNNISQDPSYLRHICFSNEATFYLNGHVHRQNVRYWSDENPRLFRECHTQFPTKLNVWAGILGNHIIGPFFIKGNLTGESYLNLLETQIIPAIHDVLTNNPGEFTQDIILQQDGAPPHYDAGVRNFLINLYPRRWIGRRGFIEWPPRSPDLTPLDFYLWGYLKSKLYGSQLTTVDELRQRIIEECDRIDMQTLQRVREATKQRIYFCQEVNGEHLHSFRASPAVI